LIGEELEIRRYETNLGNWLVDQARLALAEHGAQIAIFNSGSFRLNQNLPSGPITRRDLEEIFQYSAKLQLLRVSGAQLQTILDRSISNWSGSGHWLQVSGLAFRHDPKQGVADRLTYLGPGGPRSIQPEETFLLVIGDYIGAGGDGYSLFESMEKIPYGEEVDLKDVAAEALAAGGEGGIAPEIEGRICNTERSGPCLALP
jgi:2',3'-cyclic-nucleotide 2'-phosphodiesterase (5'-nucleotidase family)